MDDGNGKGAKLKSDAYNAAIDEAHKHNLKVMAKYSTSPTRRIGERRHRRFRQQHS
jgi:truncated hemoglobin YjbI